MAQNEQMRQLKLLATLKQRIYTRCKRGVSRFSSMRLQPADPLLTLRQLSQRSHPQLGPTDTGSSPSHWLRAAGFNSPVGRSRHPPRAKGANGSVLTHCLCPARARSLTATKCAPDLDFPISGRVGTGAFAISMVAACLDRVAASCVASACAAHH